MYRHRRHASLDSSFSAPSVRQSFTLQSSTTGQRTARLTAHTSPLALAPAISPPLPTHSEEISLAEMEMEEEMERMVTSVVDSPTEMVAGPVSPTTSSSAAELGLGLPSALQNQHRRTRSSSSRSLLSVVANTESDPKTNMGMRAAFGNYRKRCLSVQTAVAQPPVPPAVMVSSASPTGTTPPGRDVEPGSATSSFLLTPPTSPDVVQTRPALSSRGGTGSGHRRAVSAGSLPSLDQIREWSQRRQVSAGSGEMDDDKEREKDEGYEEPAASSAMKPQVLVPVSIRANNAQPRKENRLDKVLRSRTSASRLNGSVSTPSTPSAHVSTETSFSALRAEPVRPKEEKRVECARQMVNVLGKRRSLTMMSNTGIVA